MDYYMIKIDTWHEKLIVTKLKVLTDTPKTVRLSDGINAHYVRKATLPYCFNYNSKELITNDLEKGIKMWNSNLDAKIEVLTDDIRCLKKGYIEDITKIDIKEVK